MFVKCRDSLFTKMVFKNPKFDLNKNPVVVCCNDEFDKDDQYDDTALRLECSGHGSISSASSRQQDVKAAPNGSCGLVLGLGPTPSANERDLVLRLGLSYCSDTSTGDQNTVCSDHSASVEVSNGFGFGFGFDHVVDEGSTSAKTSGGYMPSLLLAPRISVPRRKVQAFEPEPSVVAGFLSETSSDHQTSGKKGVFAGSRAQETQENKKVFLGIRPRLFHGHVPCPGPVSPDNHSLSGVSGVLDSTGWLQKPAKRRQLIPPQVLVPSSMKSSSSSVSPFTKQSSSGTSNTSDPRSFGLVAPEGRVHGGSLSPLVNGNLGGDAVIDGI